MKIRENKNRNKLSKKWLVLISSLVIFIILAGLTVFLLHPRNSTVKKQNQQQTSEVDKTSTIDASQASQTSSDGTALPQKDITNPTTVNTGTSNTATPPEKPNLLRADYTTSVKVVATFQQASDGYCELQLSKPGDATLTYKANVVVGSDYYSCSFNVARSDIPASGSWTATVIHHRGDLQTSSDNATIEIR